MAKDKSSNKNMVIMELLFYAALPYVIWKFGREPLGDYVAMLLSTIPGFIYTIYRFIKDKQFNVTGVFILASLLLSTTVDLLSGSAEQMIWNGVYLGLFFTMLYFIALIIKRPLSLYFSVDFMYLQGQERAYSRELFFQKGIFKWFQMIEAVFVIRGLFMAGLTVFLLQKHGIDGYGEMLIYKQIAAWIFSAIIIGLFFSVNIPVRKYFEKQQQNQTIQQSDVVAE